MTLSIDYYCTLPSPWTYLGHDRLIKLAQENDAKINLKLADFSAVFAATGGLTLDQRPPSRQKYRMHELIRWKQASGLPINLEPKFFPVLPTPAILVTIAAGLEGADDMALAGDFMRAVWANEKNIMDPDTIIAIANAAGLDGAALLEKSQAPEIKAIFDANTQEAIDRDVFGSPSYVIEDEVFWGQDRLDFVEKKLKEGKG